STNGTRLNGARVREPVPLTEGDKIFLGATIVKFSYADGVDMEYHAKLESLVTTDALTGMLSPRRFDAAYAEAVNRARPQRDKRSVLVRDMDGLKAVNDPHGHQMGGYVIPEAAKIIRTIVGDLGATCRFGGDEFMSYLPAKDKGSGCDLAEKIRNGIV